MTQLPKIAGLEIVEKLAEGGQGAVYLVRKNGEAHALKLYNEQSATREQKIIIQALVSAGVPAKGCALRFAWPQAFVDWPKGKTFGYLMPFIDTAQHASLADIESKRVPHPGYGVMAEAGRQLAECFRELHIAGYCYRDISKKNFWLSLETGDVVICDNDNIIVDKLSLGNIKGTTPFMAPEVVLNTAKPSTVTDQHSLAVLLFCLLCGGNPFHGKIEYDIKILDQITSRNLYGLKPVFIFDPKDRSNRPPDVTGYRHVAKQWKVLPTHMKNLFIKAFTSGLNNPASRVTDIEWKNALTQMLNLRHLCRCGAETFWDPGLHNQQPCWHHGCTVDYPSKLYIKGKSIHAMLVKPDHRVTTMHFGEKSGYSTIGKMETDIDDASLVVLRNKTNEPWMAILGNQQVEISPHKAIPLYPGITIKAGKHELIVYP